MAPVLIVFIYLICITLRLKQKAKFEIAKRVLQEQVKRDGQKEKDASGQGEEADDMDNLQEDEMIYFDD